MWHKWSILISKIKYESLCLGETISIFFDMERQNFEVDGWFLALCQSSMEKMQITSPTRFHWTIVITNITVSRFNKLITICLTWFYFISGHLVLCSFWYILLILAATLSTLLIVLCCINVRNIYLCYENKDILEYHKLAILPTVATIQASTSHVYFSRQICFVAHGHFSMDN